MIGEPGTLDDVERAGETLTPIQERLDRMMAERGLKPVPVPDGETSEDRRERLRTQAQNRARRWRGRLPVMYAEAALNDLDEGQHRETIQAWLGGRSATLLLAGVVGGGKTHAAYAVGNAAVAQGLHVEAVSVHDLLQALRPEGDKDLAWAVRVCDLLVLDDLGAGKATEFAVEEITALLDTRLNSGLRQVVTTNARAVDLEPVWGSRFLDRLGHRATVCVFTGTSRRERGW